jgi:hypothetical protein
VKIGEVATATSRDSDLLSDATRVFDYKNFASPLAGFNGAEKPGRTPANDDRVPMRF